MNLESRTTVLIVTELDIDSPYHLTKPTQCVNSKMLIGKLSGKKLRAAGPPFQKTIPAVENWLKPKSILNQCLDKFTLAIQITPRIYSEKNISI